MLTADCSNLSFVSSMYSFIAIYFLFANGWCHFLRRRCTKLSSTKKDVFGKTSIKTLRLLQAFEESTD